VLPSSFIEVARPETYEQLLFLLFSHSPFVLEISMRPLIATSATHSLSLVLSFNLSLIIISFFQFSFMLFEFSFNRSRSASLLGQLCLSF